MNTPLPPDVEYVQLSKLISIPPILVAEPSPIVPGRGANQRYSLYLQAIRSALMTVSDAMLTDFFQSLPVPGDPACRCAGQGCDCVNRRRQLLVRAEIDRRHPWMVPAVPVASAPVERTEPESVRVVRERRQALLDGYEMELRDLQDERQRAIATTQARISDLKEKLANRADRVEVDLSTLRQRADIAATAVAAATDIDLVPDDDLDADDFKKALEQARQTIKHVEEEQALIFSALWGAYQEVISNGQGEIAKIEQDIRIAEEQLHQVSAAFNPRQGALLTHIEVSRRKLGRLG